jgi:hypothetical protein
MLLQRFLLPLHTYRRFAFLGAALSHHGHALAVTGRKATRSNNLDAPRAQTEPTTPETIQFYGSLVFED